MMSYKEFFKICLPLVIGFTLTRLMTQTDLIMLGHVSMSAVAALGVPSKLMIFDLIFATSLGSIISIYISSEKNVDKKKKVVSDSLMFSLVASIVLVIVGLIFYPFILNFLITDVEIKEMAHFSLHVMIFTIPFRLILFVGTMILHASKKGYLVIALDLAVLFLNFILNYFFMFYLDKGFYGCYIATAVISFFSFIVVLILVKKELLLKNIFSVPEMSWVRQLLKNLSTEWVRLSLLYSSGIVILYIVGKNNIVLTAFSCAFEIQTFLLMPFIAVMRSVAIGAGLSGLGADGVLRVKHFTRINRDFFIGTIVVLVIMMIFLKQIGQVIYHMEGEIYLWWKVYMICVLISMVVYVKNCFLKGILHSLKKFMTLTKIEFVAKWIVFIPLFGLGFWYNSPWVSFSGIVFGEILEYFYLRIKITHFSFKQLH